MIRPLANYVVVQRALASTLTPGGLTIPASVANDTRTSNGVVIAIGPDCNAVKPGDTVIYAKVQDSKIIGTTVTIEGTEFVLVRESEILATEEGRLA